MKTMHFLIVLIFFSFPAFVATSVSAQGTSNAGAVDQNLAGREYDEVKEGELMQKARKRLYPGGKDESDLKVQTQLSNPIRKMAPNMEISNSPAESASED